MDFSPINIQKYRYSKRDIQSSYINNYKGKTLSRNISLTLKHPSSFLKSPRQFHNISNNKIELNSSKTHKSNPLKISSSRKKNISIQKGFSGLFNSDKIFSSIVSKVKHLISLYKYNKIKLYYILIKIEKFINNILVNNDSKDKTTSINDNKTLDNLNISNNENNENLEGEKQESDINIYKIKINKLMQKQNELETKFKFERLSYLFCIGENQRTISELKKKIQLESIEKLPKSELNKVVCYPSYSKFDITDEINPKSIPMFPQNKNKSQQNKKNKIIQSQNQDNKYFNLLFKTELKQYKDNINKNDSSNYDAEEIENFFINEKDTNTAEINDVIKIGKKYFEERIPWFDEYLKKHKNFFITHPKLEFIKDITSGNNILRFKLGNQINSLPRQISRLKNTNSSKKNTFMFFPSFLSETLLNIEKLKTNKNFRSIDHQFEDKYKIKLKSFD